MNEIVASKMFTNHEDPVFLEMVEKRRLEWIEKEMNAKPGQVPDDLVNLWVGIASAFGEMNFSTVRRNFTSDDYLDGWAKAAPEFVHVVGALKSNSVIKDILN